MPRNTNQQGDNFNEPSIHPTNKTHGQEVDLDIQVRDRELGSLSELDPSSLDPRFTYRWVFKAPLKQARMKARGYVVVDPAAESIVNAVGESPEAADGTFSVGDTILMKIEKSMYRARRKAVRRKAEKRLKAPERRFRMKAQEKGVQRGKSVRVITDLDPEQED